MDSHPSKIIRSLFSGIDQPRIDQIQRLEKLKRNCVEFPDVKYWYLVLEVGEYPVVSWRHNTSAHLGVPYTHLTYEGYLEVVHPAWATLYYAFGAIAYGVAAQQPEQLQKNKVTFIQQVPLLKYDGRYHWYDQVVVPGTINEAGQMTSHLNFYRELGDCRHHLPQWPVVYAGGWPDPEINTAFLRERTTIRRTFLNTLFSPKQVDFLEAYRALPVVLQGREPSRKSAHVALGLSKDNYDKMLLRCRDKINAWFEEFATPSVFAFAVWVNDFFGRAE